MDAPTRAYETSKTALIVDWLALVGDETGSASIDSYNVQWDNGVSEANWYDLIGDGVTNPYTTQLSATIIDGVVPGTYYELRVRAHNAHGWSEWSDNLTLKAAGLPETPITPTTAVNNQNIRVQWVDPDANEEAIDRYRVMLAQNDRVTFVEIINYCNGANEVTISLKACEIPISVLKAAPFNLKVGEEVLAKFAAHNANGWGPYSEPTEAGALIEQIPQQMLAPTRDDLTTTLRLVVNWVALTAPENGYSEI